VKQTRIDAVKELAKYDEEMVQVRDFWKNYQFMSSEESNSIDQSIEVAKQYYISHKDEYAAWRNASIE